MANFPEEGAVGTYDSGGIQDLGVLVDAAVSSEGSVFILDESGGLLRHYDRRGMPTQPMGGFGGGPGEFEHPVTVSVGLGDTVLVADRAMKIHRFVLGSQGWSFLDQIRLGVVPEDACNSGGRVFVQGRTLGAEVQPGEWRDQGVFSGTIHQIDTEGEVLQSFSVPYDPDVNILVRERMMQGILTCDPTDRRVWVAYQYLGEVHAFSADGELLWITRLSDYSSQTAEFENGAVQPFLRDLERVDYVSGISLLSKSTLAVEVRSQAVRDGRSFTGSPFHRIYLLDPASGGGIGAVERQRILGGGNGTAVLYREIPHPQFAVVSEGGRK